MKKPILFLTSYSKNQLAKIATALADEGLDKMTIITAKGKSSSHFLNHIGLGNVDREIMLSVVEEETSKRPIETVFGNMPKQILELGFFITIPIYRAAGVSREREHKIYGGIEMKDSNKAVFIIVDKGLGDQIIKITNGLGASGATIISARGAGVYIENAFNFNIEPEKEIVLVVCSAELEEKIAISMAEILELDKANTGVLFSIPITNSVGIKFGK